MDPEDNNIRDKREDVSVSNTTDHEKCLIQFSAADISGASSKILQMNPEVAALAQKPRCVLCSKRFSGLDVVSTSRDPTCHHNFHQSCIVSWLQRNDGCPICKKPYLNETFVKTTGVVAEESETNSSLSVGKTEDNEALDQSSLGEFSGIIPTVREVSSDSSNAEGNTIEKFPSQKDDCENEEEQQPIADSTIPATAIMQQEYENTSDIANKEAPAIKHDIHEDDPAEPTEDLINVEIL